MNTKVPVVLAALALALGLGGIPRAYAAGVTVQSVLEARTTDGEGHSALILVGKGLKSVINVTLDPPPLPGGDQSLPHVVLTLRGLAGATMAIFEDSDGELKAGEYAVTLLLKNGNNVQSGKIKLALGGIVPNIETPLNSNGTINLSSNPVDWSRLKGVPAGFVDGTDDVAVYTAGTGLTVSSGQFSVIFAGTGSAGTAARSDHNHDTSYYTKGQLNTAGSINTASNPVDWSQLKGVPAGLADGTDDVSVYTPGAGLTLSSGQFSVTFAGTGSASSAARSDHNHDAAYVNAAGDSMTGALDVGVSSGTAAAGSTGGSTSGDAGLLGTATSTTGVVYGVQGTTPSTTGRGIYGQASATSGANAGVYGASASTGGFGVFASTTGNGGTALAADHTGTSGDIAQFRSAGTTVARIDKTGKAFFTGGIDQVATSTEFANLGTLGSVNTGTNPVDWTKLKGVPAGFADGTDNDTTYTNGTGLGLAGTTFSVLYGNSAGTAAQGNDGRLNPAPSSAGRLSYDAGSSWTALAAGSNGQVLKMAGGLPAWGTDTDTTYTPGTGLGLSAGAFSVQYGSTAGTAAQGNDNRLMPSPATAGRVLYDSGTAWTPLTAGSEGRVLKITGGLPAWATDDFGAYTNGTGLGLAGTTFSVQYGSSAGTATQGNDGRLNPSPASAGRMSYDAGTSWTALPAGTNGQVLKMTGGLPAWGTDTDTTYTAGTGMGLSAGAFSVQYGTTAGTAAQGNDNRFVPTPATAGRVLYDTGSAWAPLTAGAEGRVLKISGGLPAWATDDLGTYTNGAGLSLSGSQFSVSFAGSGSSSTAARSDHNHDTAYASISHDHATLYNTKTELGAAGAINTGTNPVDWTKLKGVPSSLADGTDDDTTYNAGTGLSLAGTTFSVSYSGTGSAGSSARSDHNHDTTYAGLGHNHDSRYYTQTQLNATTGVLNTATNPLDWSQMKSVPSGFADGTDDVGTYTNGAGLGLSGTTFSVNFAGTGSASTSARSDHQHDAAYVNAAGDTMSGALAVSVSTAGNAVAGSHGGTAVGDTGVFGEATSTTGTVYGVQGTTASGGGAGVYGNTAATTGKGLLGVASSTTGVNIGVAGSSASTTGIGIAATASGAGGTALSADHTGASGDIAQFKSSGSTVARIDKTGKAYFSGGIDQIPLSSDLSTAGTINTGTNPMDWTKLKGVPAGFSDGTDADTTYTAGTGLSLGSGAFSVNFAGTGSGTSAARSDHNHDAAYVDVGGDSMTGTLAVSTSSTSVSASTSGASGKALSGSATATTGTNYGVYGSTASSTGYGVYGAGTIRGVMGMVTDISGTGVVGSGPSTNTGVGVKGYGSNGVEGFTASTSGGIGVYGSSTATTGTTFGVQGEAGSSSGIGVYALSTGNGTALRANHSGTTGDIAQFQSGGGTVARIDKTGMATFNGGVSGFTSSSTLSTAGTINTGSNPMDWTKLKGVPSEFADGTDDIGAAGTGLSLAGTTFSVQYGSTSGTATQGNDTRLIPAPSTAGRIPYDTGTAWSALTAGSNGQVLKLSGGLPSWGTDIDTTYTAGTGLTLSTGAFSVNFAGTGSATTASKSDHDHDTRYYTQSQLNATTGTLNTSTNPVDWSQMKSVPAGFADGTDADTTYTAGTGITLSTGAFSVNFAGAGSASTAARSDHNHDSSYLGFGGGSLTGALTATTSSGISVTGSSSSLTGTGVKGADTNSSGTNYGVYGSVASTSGYGVYGTGPDAASGVGAYGAGLYGVQGETAATTGRAVYGNSTSTTGACFGIYGATPSSAGTGVYGLASNATGGSTYGVYGESTSSQGIGVFGKAPNSNNLSGGGVHGEGDTLGVFGLATSASGVPSRGVHGSVASTSGQGVFGSASATTGTNYGVYGISVSSAGTGVYGSASHSSGSVFGVYGTVVSSAGVGVYAASTGTGTALRANHSGASGDIAQFQDSGTTVARIDKTGKAYFSGGIDQIPTTSDLGTAGTINTGSNPVDWTKLKNVPSGIADGVDSDTTYTAGTGLGLSGGAFSVNFAGTGSASTSARSDHNHDSAYLALAGGTLSGSLSATSGTGTTISGSNTAAGTGTGVYGSSVGSGGRGVSGEATGFIGYGVFGKSSGGAGGGGYGVYGQATTTGGTGVQATSTGNGTALRADHTGTTGDIAQFQSGGTTVARIDKTGKAYFDGGIDQVPTTSDLGIAGTINTGSNPVDWTKLKNVPTGFADGTDADTTYTAGSGLTLSSTQFAVDFAGAGSATTAARSDHNHDAAYVDVGGDSMTGALTVTTSSGTSATGSSSSATGTGVRGVNTNTSGTNYGVLGETSSMSTDAAGVYGRALGTTGTSAFWGVFGETAGGNSSLTAGVHGRFTGNIGNGVYGLASSSSGANVGVYGVSSSTSGTGVFGKSFVLSGSTVGVFGMNQSTDGGGVLGLNNSTSGTVYGVRGDVGSSSGKGVYGVSTSTSGTTYGVYGQAASSSGVGVHALASGTGTAFRADHTGASGDIAQFQSGGTTVARIDKSGVGYFNGGVNGYPSSSSLGATGTINTGTNPVDWTQLKNVPTGIADGTDADTTYTNGAGLTLASTTFAVDFAGTGSATTVSRSDHNHDAAYVDVGGDSMTGALSVSTGAAASVSSTTSSATGKGVLGTASSGTGTTYGVYGLSSSTGGFGVYGEGGNSGVWGHTATTSGYANGVVGTTASSGGNGVKGDAPSASGATFGVHGIAASTSGTGVAGEATASTGTTYGVYGSVASNSGYGVYGVGGGAGSGAGVCGEGQHGVFGVSTTSTGQGVLGTATGSAGIGVQGDAQSTTGQNYGVSGQSESNSGVGVRGVASSTTGSTMGVYGSAVSDAGIGVRGESGGSSGAGVYARMSGTGTGLVVNHTGASGDIAQFQSGGSTVASIDRTGMATFNGGISGYSSSASLSTSGVINTGTNPVDWTQLKNVPSGIADGTDSDTTYTNGTGLGLAGTTFSVNFAGTGSASTAARSDHNHDATYLALTGGVLTGSLTAALASGQAIDVSNSGSDGTISTSSPSGVRGQSTATSGAGIGVVGMSASASGAGVWGENTNTTGNAASVGVFGKSSYGNGGVGVFGECVANTGATYGVYGQSTSTSGIGVRGEATSTTGTTYGLYGTVASTTGGFGVYGLASGTSGAASGVRGESAASAGYGVYAVVTGNATALCANHGGASGDIAQFQSGGTTVARIDKTGKAYFSGGVDQIPLSSDLSTAGTINTGSNPVDWTKLKGVPAGFSDGTDADTTYTAGSGLTLSSTQFAVDFSGNGSATTASRSDHNHDAAYVNVGGDSMTGGLSVTVGSGSAVAGNGTTVNGILGDQANGYGVYGNSGTGSGVYGVGGTVGVYGYSPSGVGSLSEIGASSTADIAQFWRTTKLASIDKDGKATFSGGITGFTSTAGSDTAYVNAGGDSMTGALTVTTSSGDSATGSSSSTTGTGVKGENTATTGTNYGVYGSAASTSGRGVFGSTTASSGTTYGVYGLSSSTGGFGVYGEGGNCGVWGRSLTAAGGANGVVGTTVSTDGNGVRGDSTASTGATFGVHGLAASTSGFGVSGEATASTGTTYGVYGSASSASGYGIFGTGPSTSTGTGVRGEGASGVEGASAAASGIGVLATASGTGTALRANHTGASGSIAQFQSGSTTVASIDKSGVGSFNSGAFTTSFAGTGSASTVARSDHSHATRALLMTAGEAISAGQPVYYKVSDGKIYKANGNAQGEPAYNFLGFAGQSVSANGTFEVNMNYTADQSSLTTGALYYLSTSAGTISTTPGTAVVFVGRAVSTTEILRDYETRVTSGTISDNTNITHSAGGGSNTDTTVTHNLGVVPKLVVLSCRIKSTSYGASFYSLTTGVVAYNPGGIAYGSWSNMEVNGASNNNTTGQISMHSATNMSAQVTSGSADLVTVSVLNIGATSFTFRINSVDLSNGGTGASSVSEIAWTVIG